MIFYIPSTTTNCTSTSITIESFSRLKRLRKWNQINWKLTIRVISIIDLHKSCGLFFEFFHFQTTKSMLQRALQGQSLLLPPSFVSLVLPLRTRESSRAPILLFRSITIHSLVKMKLVRDTSTVDYFHRRSISFSLSGNRKNTVKTKTINTGKIT